MTGRRLELPSRYDRPHSRALLLLWALLIGTLAALAWCSWPPPPLPPLADDAQLFGDCTLEQGAACEIWPH